MYYRTCIIVCTHAHTHLLTFSSIDDIVFFGTIKSSKNRRLSKNFHVVGGGTLSVPVPVGNFFFFFLSRPKVTLKDLIFRFYT